MSLEDVPFQGMQYLAGSWVSLIAQFVSFFKSLSSLDLGTPDHFRRVRLSF